MAKTRGGHSSSSKPRVRPSSLALSVAPPPISAGPVAPAQVATTPPPAPVSTSTATAPPPPTVTSPAAPTAAALALFALVQGRYETRVEPTPPSPPHPSHQEGPRLQRGLGLQVQVNPPARGPRSILRHHHD